jgi:monoterpene epsilon-lactone hydrolase
MLWLIVVLLIALWLIARFRFVGPDLSTFDEPKGPPRNAGQPVSPQTKDVLARLATLMGPMQRAPRRERLPRMRRAMDAMGEGLELDTRIVPIDAAGVRAEWVTCHDSVPGRRLLYVHGGAFTMGSPKSHRAITAAMAKQARAAVLAIDYRLMPEHRRRDGIDDCRAAYRWILDNGPDGERGPPSALFVAGDSAGGNLALMLTAWARDEGLRAVDGAVALSPATDSTFGSPSLKANVATDPMFRTMARIPRWLMLWFAVLTNRANPRDPSLSPVYGDLAGLPPTLVQASDDEILIDDARRYVNKARAAGSPVALETWHGMVHVWQIFVTMLPEAQAAFEAIGAFFERCAPTTTSATAAS